MSCECFDRRDSASNAERKKRQQGCVAEESHQDLQYAYSGNVHSHQVHRNVFLSVDVRKKAEV